MEGKTFFEITKMRVPIAQLTLDEVIDKSFEEIFQEIPNIIIEDEEISDNNSEEKEKFCKKVNENLNKFCEGETFNPKNLKVVVGHCVQSMSTLGHTKNSTFRTIENVTDSVEILSGDSDGGFPDYSPGYSSDKNIGEIGRAHV